MTSFADLQLCEPLINALAKLHISTPTEVQAASIPLIMKGSDLVVQAQTGSGKTLAFALPIMQKLQQQQLDYPPASGDYRPAKLLVLAPTRELADQIREDFIHCNQFLRLRITLLIGGQRLDAQWAKLKKGSDIIIATPGRLLDLLNQEVIELNKLTHLVFDEADRMLDMGFAEEINKILEFIPKKRQTLLFSATYDSSIQLLANELCFHPQRIRIENNNVKIQHRIFKVARSQKLDVLVHLLNKAQFSQVMVFTKTKNNADEVAIKLAKAGFDVAAIHGDKSQKERTGVLAEFKNKALSILVATDVAARGIDIKNLPCVVNFDFPQAPQDYIHRIGRTARAGKAGQAISFVNEQQQDLIDEISRMLDTDLKIKPSPIAATANTESAEPAKAKEKAGIVARQGGRPGIRF